MLTLVMCCRAKGLTVGPLSREIALDIAESVYRPLLAVHIAGGAYITADALSKLLAPDKKQLLDLSKHGAKGEAPTQEQSVLPHPCASGCRRLEQQA